MAKLYPHRRKTIVLGGPPSKKALRWTCLEAETYQTADRASGQALAIAAVMVQNSLKVLSPIPI